ncbi:MAG TPA: glycosyl hydrolase [Steroidobacteraceae bacterium]|nr:glycosyl hydrolase [Steroidobacteraceae bacterium]
MKTFDPRSANIPGGEQPVSDAQQFAPLVSDAERLAPLTRRSFLSGMGATGAAMTLLPALPLGVRPAWGAGADPLVLSFRSPADGFKVWAYWWWLDGGVTKAGLTADLEAMKQQGIVGVIVFDCGFGGPRAPKGPQFMSPEWRESFHHAVAEAARLGIELSVNLCSGWNAGGPWVTRDDAIKHLVWQETVIEGPRSFDAELPRYVEQPPRQATESMNSTEVAGSHAVDAPTPWYRDIAVLACEEEPGGLWKLGNIRDLTAQMSDGRLRWKVPKGTWKVLRMGFIVPLYDVENGDDSIRTKARSAPNPPAWEIDPMSAAAMDRHFAETAAKLIGDAGALAGTTFKYLHIDSWEMGLPTWTPKFVEEFAARRRYSPLPYLPGLAGKTVESAEITARFVWDYRRTIADLISANYYGRLAQLAHAHGLGTHPESGGPWYTQYIDALECLGTNDIPMAEFWSSRGSFHGIERKPTIYGIPQGFFTTAETTLPQANFGSIKQAASAAHVYGKPIFQAEAFTSFNSDWTADPYYLKSFGDRAFCLGMTRNVLNFYVSQSSLTDKPGYEWEHIGPHFDRNVTWWSKSHAWFAYMARCQQLLRQGFFCADLLYFTGEAIPNFALLDRKPVAGHDFDVINAQALLARTRAEDGHVVLPEGTRYRYLIIPQGVADAVSPAVASKLKELVEGGATLLAAPPKNSLGLTNYPRTQQEVAAVVDALWGGAAPAGMRQVGAGRVIWGKPIEDVLSLDGLAPDLELRGAPRSFDFDWIHRRDRQTDLYFIANLSELEADVEVAFRLSGRTPELWDAVTGATRELDEFREENGRTVVPLRFAAKQSWFVVFRAPVKIRASRSARNFPALRQLGRITGPWTVSFDQDWGGPESVVFQNLDDWTQRPEAAIRFYSGAATYRNSFRLPRAGSRRIHLELGDVRNLAQVRVNGKDAGIVWTAPWRVEIGGLLRPGNNDLEIEVVNLWPNRLIGDGELPESERRTKTNVRTYDRKLPADFSCWWDAECEDRKKRGAPAKLLSSGLMGPVVLVSEEPG